MINLYILLNEKLNTTNKLLVTPYKINVGFYG